MRNCELNAWPPSVPQKTVHCQVPRGNYTQDPQPPFPRIPPTSALPREGRIMSLSSAAPTAYTSSYLPSSSASGPSFPSHPPNTPYPSSQSHSVHKTHYTTTNVSSSTSNKTTRPSPTPSTSRKQATGNKTRKGMTKRTNSQPETSAPDYTTHKPSSRPTHSHAPPPHHGTYHTDTLSRSTRTGTTCNSSCNVHTRPCPATVRQRANPVSPVSGVGRWEAGCDPSRGRRRGI